MHAKLLRYSEWVLRAIAAVVGRRRIRAVSALHHMTGLDPCIAFDQVAGTNGFDPPVSDQCTTAKQIAFHTNLVVTDPPDGLLMYYLEV